MKKSRVLQRGREREHGKERTVGETEIEKKEKSKTSRSVINSIHGATEGNLCCISIDSKNLGSYMYIYIARECETRVELVSNSVTRAKFDYVSSLTLHTACVMR